MKQKAREALDAYYHEAGSWARDREADLARSRRTAWIVAAVASVVALALALALLALTPLKTVEPYTLLVDRQTGYVQQLKPLDAAKVAPDTALTQSFLVQYVIARESFDINALQSNYRKTVLWSDGAARSRYVASVQASNPESPLASLPRSSVIETRIKSVSPLDKDSALVRFNTQRRDANGQTAPAQAWVTVIRYRYSGEPMSLEDRLVNPLGFQVASYTRNAEALSPPEPVAAPVAANANLPSPLQPSATPVPAQTAAPAQQAVR